jgi:cell division transport system permease protein
MKLVGATPWFIKRPYIVSSMMNGFIASLVSLLMLLGVVVFVEFQFGLSSLLIQPITAGLVSFIVILLGVAISAISSYFSVGRFVKLNTNDMYFM